jgi:hypothetical protein
MTIICHIWKKHTALSTIPIVLLAAKALQLAGRQKKDK